MSDFSFPKFKWVTMPNGMVTLQPDDLKDLDNLEIATDSTIKMDYESGNEPKSPPYNCQIGYHEWKWYEGLGIDCYWFCVFCDKKDRDKKPPKSNK